MTTQAKESEVIRPLAARVFELMRRMIQLLPATFVLSLSGKLGVLAQYFCSRERNISNAQIQFALGKDSSEASEITRNVFRHIGMFIGEVLLIERILRESDDPSGEIEIEEEGGELLDRLNRENQSIVLLSGHIGNFELLAAYHNLRSRPVAGVGRHANYKVLDQILKDFRATFNYKMFWRDDSRVMGKVLKELKKGAFYGGFLDQDTALDNSFAPFFGLAAASPSVPLQLAVKYKYPVVTTFCLREAPLKYRIITKEIDYDTEAPDAAQQILVEYNRRVEEIVSHYPEQWPWWHRRWRRRPDINYRKEPEALPSSGDYLAWLAKQPRANSGSSIAPVL